MDDAIKDSEIQRLEEQITGLENQLQQRYCQMGKELLELADGELKAVNGLVDDIIHARRKLATARREIQCANCMAYNTADSNYCKHCGSMLDTKEQDNGR